MCVRECARARARMCAAATCVTRRNTGDAPDRDAGAPRNLGECPRALQHAFAPAQEAQGAPAHGRVGCLRVHTHSRAAAQVSPRGHAATPQIPRQPRHAPRRPRACRRRGTGKPPAQITLHLRDSRGLRGCPLPFSPAFPLAARRRAPGTQRSRRIVDFQIIGAKEKLSTAGPHMATGKMGGRWFSRRLVPLVLSINAASASSSAGVRRSRAPCPRLRGPCRCLYLHYCRADCASPLRPVLLADSGRCSGRPWPALCLLSRGRCVQRRRPSAGAR